MIKKTEIKQIATQSVLFLTHIVNDTVLQRFYKLRYDCHGEYDVWFVYNDDSSGKVDFLCNCNVFKFSLHDIMHQGYTPLGVQVLHNVNYIVQLFRKQHPEYNHYWVVEYDVCFIGSWTILFDYYRNQPFDLIASHVERFGKHNCKWCWWHHTNLSQHGLDSSAWMKSFNPIYRISANALSIMNEFLKTGVQGHYEVLMATGIYHSGLSIRDMGGTGEFADPDNPNLFYVKLEGESVTLMPGTTIINSDVRINTQ